ncbi:MAG TPA: hypothetical protein VLR91_06270 [Thermodesulfobacteriota bacterium]|nr:hypothetical protein [Thermodesulfobacteriota bacterium]
MPPRKKRLLFGLLLIFLLVTGVAAYLFSFQPRRPVEEVPVKVIQIHLEGEGRGSLPQEAVWVDHLSGRAAIIRLNYLRAERLEVVPEKIGDRIHFQLRELGTDEYAVLNPQQIKPGTGLNPIAGIGDETLIRLTVAAGIRAITEKNNQETLRFLSPHYSDSWGFNARLMEQVIRRAYKEFDRPRIELNGPPVLRIQNKKAQVSASIRLTAIYQGRRNYLLGDAAQPNSLWLQLGTTGSGWKLENVKGLQPLGFEENFFKLLGSEVGLPLTDKEKAARQQACMPCRDRMAERFGPYR